MSLALALTLALTSSTGVPAPIAQLPAHEDAAAPRLAWRSGAEGAALLTLPAQTLEARVSARGVDVVVGGELCQSPSPVALALRTSSFGRVGAVEALPAGAVSIVGDRARIAHPGLEEWFQSHELGLEQGWTLTAPPSAARGAGELWIGLAFDGLFPRVTEDGLGALLVDHEGRNRMRYHSLVARDASGRELTARLRTTEHGLGIAVDDRDARYPIVVDPILGPVAWSFLSGQGGAQLSVGTTAGDVNGDGYSDFLAATPAYRTFGSADGSEQNGRAWLFLGSATGLVGPVLILTGAQSPDALGKYATALGDIDQDGYDDVAIGAPGANVPGVGTSGAVYVYRGSATGLIATPFWTIAGTNSGERMGQVQHVGDVDGDGRDDVFVCNDIQGGPPARANLYRGSSSATPGTPMWTMTISPLVGYGVDIDSKFVSLAGVGDVDADGFDDFAFSTDRVQTGTDARVFLFRGASPGPSTLPTWVGDLAGSPDNYGALVRGLGDVQGDGYADFGLLNSTSGTLYVYAGGPTAVPTQLGLSLGTPGTNPWFNTAGDLDGDSLADLVTGVPSSSQVRVYRGTSTGFGGSPLFLSSPGGGGSDRFGAQVGTAGDVNGDGRSDLFVTAPGTGAFSPGTAYVYLGQPPTPPCLPPTSGATSILGTSNSLFSSSIALQGDVNGDGHSDLLIGSPTKLDGGIPTGFVELHLGSANGINPVPSWTFPPAGPGFANHRIGASVAFAGDVNNDGFSDLLVGAPGTTNGQANEGRAYLFYGNASGAPSTTSGQFWFFESNELDAEVGFAVSAAGDINGDGFPDVAVGAPGRHLGDLNRGAVYVFHGATTGLSTTPAHTLDAGGPASNTRFGAAVACAGDVNQDGLSDLVVGAPDADDGSFQDAGAAHLYVGTGSGLATTPTSTGRGGSADARYGAAVASAGDVDRDGHADLVVGAPSHEALLPTGGGRVYLYRGLSGPAPDVFNAPTQVLTGGQANAEFGAALGGIGDLDLDGFSDLLVGARRYDSTGVDAGRTFVFLGTSTGVATPAAQVLDGTAAGAQFGGAIATAGDWNGDGFSDFVGAQPNLNGDTGGLLIYLGTTDHGGLYRSQQRRVSAVLALERLCLVDSTTSLYLNLEVRQSSGATATLAGRERVQLEYELKEFAQPLNGTQLARSARVDSGALGGSLTFHELASTLQTGRGYHWRVRQKLGNPAFPHTLWQSLQGSGLQEKKLGTGFDCNNNGLEDGAETAANPALDCNSNHVPDACDIANGFDPDCDNDAVPNSCELFANDCDGDALPDDCELAAGAPDCNGNNVLDNCDITSGASLDANADQIPDECEFVPYCFGDGTGAACPCANFGTAGRGCANSVNASGARLTVTGVPHVFGDTVVLQGSGMPNSVSPSAIYLQGTLRDNGGSGTAVYDGLRCVSGSLIRLGTKANSGGASQYPDVGNTAVSVRGLIPSGGGTYHYQVFYRNAAAAFCPPGTANWSNAVSIVWTP